MNKDDRDMKKEDIIDSFIDDLNNEKKPQAYEKNGDIRDEELDELFETIRAVKRLKKSDFSENKVRKSKKTIKGRLITIGKIGAIASIFLLVFMGGSFFGLPFDLGKESENESKFQLLGNESVVHAMVKAYEQLNSYEGIIEIRSQEDGQMDSLHIIEVKYKKPNKFYAVHSYDGYSYTQISDGEKLYTIDSKEVVIDYSNPEKELWRYHIGNQIQELAQAREIKEIGSEIVAGRDAIVYEYRFSSEESFNRLWVDKETNLPLKNELNLPENRQLINHFIELEVNTEINDKEFTYETKEGQKTIQLNSKIDREELNKVWNKSEDLIKEIPNSFKLTRIVKLENEIYEYLMKFRDDKNDEYLDVYISLKPVSDYYFKESQHGILGDGWVEMQQEAINLFKVYIGKSNYAKWVNKDEEIVIVSSRNSKDLSKILEKFAKDKITTVTLEELKNMGINSPITKEGH